MQKFTYGDQFSPNDFTLKDLVALIRAAAGDREALQKSIQDQYWEAEGRSEDNKKKLAMNTVLSLNAYGLISFPESRDRYEDGDFTKVAEEASDEDSARLEFSKFILSQREGLILCRVIESLKLRNVPTKLEPITLELRALDFDIAPNCTYVSTMKAWLHCSGVFRDLQNWDVDWEKIDELIGVKEETLTNLFELNNDQLMFLKSAFLLGVWEKTSSSKVAKHCREVLGYHLTTKMLPKEVLEPLAEKGIDLPPNFASRNNGDKIVKYGGKSWEIFATMKSKSLQS